MGNFVSNDNATSLVTKVGNCLDTRPKTWTGTHDEWALVSAADQAKYEYVNFTDDYEQGGGGGGGHVIEDATGTDLTQRANLQFKGVRVSDDSTNDRTVVDATNETIDWSSWIAMTDAQQEAYLEAHPNLTVLNAPYEDADIPFMTKLWENPAPTSEFGAQSITLSSDDYDFILVLAGLSSIICANDNITMRITAIAGSTASPYHTVRFRNVAANGITVTFSDGYIMNANPATADNTVLIPTAIYGLKKSVSINAIAADVSTSASKCMMNSGASVETSIGTLSNLTTTDKSNIVSAVNEVNGKKANNILMSDNVTTVEQAITNGTTSDGLHNVTLSTNFSVSEYFNYFKIGKLVVVNIGGLITSNDSTGIGITSDLPIQRSRPIGVLKNDVASNSTIVFGQIGTRSLAIAAHDANVHYWGQFVYLTD